MTQVQLAAANGGICTQENISRLERTDAEGSELIVQFAHALGVSAQWLALGTGEMIPPRRSDDPDGFLDRISELYKQCDDRGRLSILAVAEREASYVTSRANEPTNLGGHDQTDQQRGPRIEIDHLPSLDEASQKKARSVKSGKFGKFVK